MILSALNDYYQQLLNEEKISPYGYRQEKISFAIVLDTEGKIVQLRDIRDTSGKKPKPEAMSVPAPPKRTSGINPCFLWDKTSYVLGVSNTSKRKEAEHDAFRTFHQQELKDEQDPGMQALLLFLDTWSPEQFESNSRNEDSKFSDHAEEILDKNVVFRLNDEQCYLHDRPAAREAWKRWIEKNSHDLKKGICLITGKAGPIARLHPDIKGVKGAQSSGASIVSFNQDSFESYDKKQGDNAPISEKAAFAYTTTLNYLLRYDRQKLQIGDTSVVFWAKGSDQRATEEAEKVMAQFLDPKEDDKRATRQVQDVLEQVRQGLPLKDLEGDLDDVTFIFVLGLAPNAGRLSIRFWEPQTLDTFAKRLCRHFDDLALEPSPWSTPPAVWKLLLATVPHRSGAKPRSADVPPQLAGELTRSILTGCRYPRSLLSNIIMRFRADGHVDGTRVALCKAVLVRQQRLGNITKGEPPVSLDPTNTDPGYLLGRLFSALENVQGTALGKLNATIGDRYYGAASATPASVFPVLLRNARHHLSGVRKDKPGLAVYLEKALGEIINQLDASFPKSLSIESQGHFAIGYYHQTRSRYRSDGTTEHSDMDSEGEHA